MNKLISFEGGSGFGKSSTAEYFKNNKDFLVYESISKEVYSRMGTRANIAEEFTNIFYDFRLKQYQESLTNDSVKFTLFDRFLFFPIAMRIFTNLKVPNYYYEILEKECLVENVFIFDPIPLSAYPNGWPRTSISYDESMHINEITANLVENMGCKITIVPFDSVKNRAMFVKESLS